MGDTPGTEVFNYMAHIADPAALGIIDDGGPAQLEKNFSGMNTYFQIISGGAGAGKSLGPRYMFKTNARCVPGGFDKSGEHVGYVDMDHSSPSFGDYNGPSGLKSELDGKGCNKDTTTYQVVDANNNPMPVYTCPRSIYVETTQGGGPAGGLLGSAAINIEKINPLKLANDAFAGALPDCGYVELRTRNCNGSGTSCDDFTTDKALLFPSDIESINKCFFSKGGAIPCTSYGEMKTQAQTEYDNKVEQLSEESLMVQGTKLPEYTQELEDKLASLSADEEACISNETNVYNPTKPNDVCTASDFAAMGICPGPGLSNPACVPSGPTSGGTSGGGGGGCPTGCVEGLDGFEIKLPNSKLGKAYYIGLSALALYILFKILYKKH